MRNKLVTVIIFVAAAAALIIVYLNYDAPTVKTVPAILEDSLSDDTNLLLDTVSGKSKNPNEIEPIEKPAEQ